MGLKPAVISGLTEATYQSHPFHRDTEAWSETNCYVDLWIEVLHSLGLDPFALLPFSFAADFEGDQWTFLKPSLDDLWSLYGIDVQELNIWNRLGKHIGEQVEHGSLSLVEVDAFFLPDTQGVSYQTEHTKTTIAVNAIDFANAHLGYFHNSGYYELSGQDFRDVLRLDKPTGDDCLAPYTEFAKLSRHMALNEGTLRKISLSIAQRHLQRCPKQNPITKYRAQFGRDVEVVLANPVSYYHKYAFATLRQMGTGFLLSALYLRWLEEGEDFGLGDAARAFLNISDGAKALLFKMARSVNSKKPLPYEAIMDTMEADWQSAQRLLSSRLECCRNQ